MNPGDKHLKKLIIVIILTAVIKDFSIAEILGAWLEEPVTLDGRILPESEWSDASCHDFDFHLYFSSAPPYLKSRVWIKNDRYWLYLLYRIEREIEPYHPWNGAQISWYYGMYKPPWDYSDLGSLSVDGEAWDACKWDDRQWYPDAGNGGRNNVQGSVSHDGKYYWFEFRKALISEDGCDIDLLPGNIYPVLIGFWDNLIRQEYHRSVYIQIYSSDKQ